MNNKKKSKSKVIIIIVAAAVILLLAFVFGGKGKNHGGSMFDEDEDYYYSYGDDGYRGSRNNTSADNTNTSSGMNSQGSAGFNGSASGGSYYNSDEGSQAQGSMSANGKDDENGINTHTHADKENLTIVECTISVSCGTILNNKDDLKENKTSFVPENGYILMPTSVSFENGETVLNVLKRVMRDEKIQLQVNNSGSAFVESIGNIYNSDCGDMSGWLYSVNNEFPSESVSDYVLKNGDIVKFMFTCDGGADVGLVF